MEKEKNARKILMQQAIGIVLNKALDLDIRFEEDVEFLKIVEIVYQRLLKLYMLSKIDLKLDTTYFKNGKVKDTTWCIEYQDQQDIAFAL